MKLEGWLSVLCAAVAFGCVSQNAKVAEDRGSPAALDLTATNVVVTVTPAAPILGKVTVVNPALRFVVIDFSLGGVPALESRLNVLRKGQNVAEVKISGPQSGTLIAADITDGTVQAGDEVREK